MRLFFFFPRFNASYFCIYSCLYIHVYIYVKYVCIYVYKAVRKMVVRPTVYVLVHSDFVNAITRRRLTS